MKWHTQLPAKGLRLVSRALKYHIASVRRRPSKFGIHPGYVHRSTVAYFDDTENTDNWQREVYERAAQVMMIRGLSSVYDIGCGSGFKLMQMLGEYDTTGIDLPETIKTVRHRYPSHKWLAGSFEALDLPPADLVVCSDVIEHVADPDALMRFIVKSSSGWVVLSTPERNLVYNWRNRHRFGPPENPAHLREWNMTELRCYVEQYLDVEEHFISNAEQATQCVVGRVKT